MMLGDGGWGMMVGDGGWGMMVGDGGWVGVRWWVENVV